MEIPSDTVMVLNCTLLPPAASAPAAAASARWLIWTLQGVRFDQVEAMPICDLVKSASPNPTARNMERAGVCLTPSTTVLEYCRGSGAAGRRTDLLFCLLLAMHYTLYN